METNGILITVQGISVNHEEEEYAVLFTIDADEEKKSLYISDLEAEAFIADQLERINSFKTMLNIIDTFNAEINYAIIDRVDTNGIYFASMNLSYGPWKFNIDARPLDVIGMQTVKKFPLYISPMLLGEDVGVGVGISEEKRTKVNKWVQEVTLEQFIVKKQDE